MKSIRSVFSGLLVIGGCVGLFSLLHAQETAVPVQASALSLTATDVASFSSLSDTELETLVNALAATPTLSVDALPLNGRAGTFYSLQNPNWPPLPGDTSGSDAWSLSGGAYLLNDLDFNYDVPQKQSLAKGVTMHAMDFSSPPSFSESSGTNTPDDTVMPPVNYGTNLWIAQTLVTNRYLTGIGSNTLADVQYEIQSVTNIAQTDWQSEGFILGSETTNWTPLSVAQGSRTNQLFLRLRSWADDGSGLPIWWQLQYFGTTGVDPYGDPAGDGWSNLQKFQNGWNPNSFYTPPTPPLTVSLNVTNGLATLNWLPSPGPVTNYLVIKYDYQTGLQTEFNFSPGTNRFADDLSADVPESIASSGPELDVSYQIQAQYPNGNSALGDEQWAESGYPAILLISGTQGSAYLAASSLPPGTVGLRLTRVDHQAEAFYGDPSFDTNYFIPTTAFTNGLYLLPTSVTTPPTDAYGYALYEWWVEIVNAQGQPVNWPGLLSEGYYLGDNYAHSWMGTPYFDGRVQLKQNLTFLFRAANAGAPLHFAERSADFHDFNNYTNPPGYAYAGLFELDDPESPTYGQFDTLALFENNYLYRNFAYSTANVNTSGSITTGLFTDQTVVQNSLILQDVPTYQFALPTYNGQVIAPVLATNDTRWLCQYPLSLLGGDATLIGITSQQPTSGSLIWTLGSSAQNYWGLPYVSAKLAYANGSGGLATTTLSPGGSFQIANASVYLETAPPQFQTVEYDFWNRPSWPYANTVLPGQAAFSPTNASQLLIANVGQNNFQVMGYAKLAVTNSAYSGVYGYLGQYFDQAYKITNGVATTNTTGVLSSYGNFFPTEPGPAALVTMPDPDTGARGTGIVQVISAVIDRTQGSNMDLSFSGTDATSANNPAIIWTDNNYDRGHTVDGTDFEQDDLGPVDIQKYSLVPDCQYTTNGLPAIPCTRDLEDYFRLWTPGVAALMKVLPANYTVQLTLSGAGQIRIFQAIEPDGGTNYLFDETTASNQVARSTSLYVGLLTSASPIVFNITTNFNEHFIFCGVTNGSAQIDLQVLDNNGNVLADAPTYLQINDIKQMYERFTVGDEPGTTNQEPMATAVLAAQGLPVGVSAFQYTRPQDTNTPYILFVHGWNMNVYDKDRFAETAFKRLYWQGYRGRFGSFRWPTYFDFPFGEWALQAVQPRNFDDSESNAWASAVGLLNKLTELNAEYPGHVYLAAHSMGNVVAGEALRLATNQVVNTYVAMQAAVASHAYDPNTPGRSLTSTFLTWDSGTPDRYANYWTSGAPCYFNSPVGAASYVNFYNTNDWALRLLWTLDQDAKPDNAFTSYPGYHYSTSSGFYKIVGSNTNNVHILNFPTNTYEIFSFCDEARCQALGRQKDVVGIFFANGQTNQVALDGSPYGFGGEHKYHSGEFRSDNAQRSQFWKSVLIKMGLKEE